MLSGKNKRKKKCWTLACLTLNINVEWQNNKNNNKKKEKKKEAMLDVDGLIKVGGYMV
jgi:hypothetical protein